MTNQELIQHYQSQLAAAEDNATVANLVEKLLHHEDFSYDDQVLLCDLAIKRYQEINPARNQIRR